MSGATGLEHKLARRQGEIRGTLSWAGTHEAKTLLADQALLPANARLLSISINPSGATIEDIIVGDGTTGNRWVTITSGLAAGWQDLTLANRYAVDTTAARNKFTFDPDTNATMTLDIVVRYELCS